MSPHFRDPEAWHIEDAFLRDGARLPIRAEEA